MRFRKAQTVAAAVVVTFLLTATASAQPAPADPPRPVHFLSPVRVMSDGGADLRRPPGWYVPDAVWDDIDFKVRVLQDDRTRLTAENESLRASADRPGWGWLLGFAVGTAAGIVATFIALR